jgi:hypothetical protein
MNTQLRIENTLKQIHLLFARSHQAGDNPDEIVVNKKELFMLLEEINACMYDMMDEYEVSKESKERIVRQAQRRGEELIEDANKNADDIYAASVLYTDSALNEMRSSLEKSMRKIQKVYNGFVDDMSKQMQTIQENKYELKEQLAELLDSGKYLRILDAENKKDAQTRREETKEWAKQGGNPALSFSMPEAFADLDEPIRIVAPAPEIKVNPAFAENTILDGFRENTESAGPQINVNLDAEYFKWKEGRQEPIDLDAEYFAWQEEKEQMASDGGPTERSERAEPVVEIDLELVKQVAARREEQMTREENGSRKTHK